MLTEGVRTITTIQAGSVYKERWLANLGGPWPDGSTATATFYDSLGRDFLTIIGSVTPTAVTFSEQPEIMNVVPNGALFSVYLSDDEGPHLIRYGSVYRREPFFPDAVTP